jgi:glycosyltransferase involved in cell wall biosynthesis
VTDSVPTARGLHLLAYGGIDSGVTDSLRLGVLRGPLAELGIEVRAWSSFADDVLNGARAPGAGRAAARGGLSAAWREDSAALAEAGLTALAWADLILFRRWHSTHTICTECEAAFAEPAGLEGHLQVSGHHSVMPDTLLRPVVELVAAHPELLGGRAVVYETDDDLFSYPDWTGLGPTARRERDLIERLLGLADLVTTSTPVLAERLAAHTRAPVRVIRNAIDPAWYPPRADGGETAAGDLRVVYHGVPVRLRDYEIARPAVDVLAAELPGLRRIWLGAANERRVVAAMDEVRPWVDGLPEFAAALVAARPDVGLAPLVDEPFNRAKSELHWLEYSMAGAATIVSGFKGGGPYDPVRDGVDGLIARSPADWQRHLGALVASPGLRADIAGRARERVLAEYSLATRVGEWADAYHWAADHAGSRRGATRVVSVATGPAVAGPELRVLVLGPGAAGASDALRFEAVAPALAGHGIELVSRSPADMPAGSDATRSNADGEFEALEAALAWSDVVVLRRSYRTAHVCLGCPVRTFDRAEIRAHAAATGHSTVESPFALIRPLVGLLEAEPGALGDRALVYETDDDIFAADLAPGAEDWLERDLVERMLALADLVTTTTPVLAARLSRRTQAPVRVIRNALDPACYGAARRPGRTGRAPGDPRLVYHGVAGRIHDYEIARPAVDAVAREFPALRRVWLGATTSEIAGAVDETRPWVAGLPGFAAALVAADPDIGLAPLADTSYNRARSELHWLEYALAGAPTIASGFADAGPYDPIRDGVDGLIARTPADWERHLRALAGSPALRAEIAGRARERVLADYSVSARAAEWAAAYRWAAEHSGSGRRGRIGA